MRKQRRSVLIPHADALMQMDAEKKTYAEMVAWLKREGVICVIPTVPSFLEAERSRRLEAQLLENIMTGAQQCRDVEKQFGENSPPALETLIKLHRVIILRLATQANANPQFLKLADQLLRTVMEYFNSQTEIAQKERALRLAEDKFQIACCTKLLDATMQRQAEEIAASSMTQAEKIAALRKVAFQDVEALEQSGSLRIPEV